jgi:hypothetical protein
MAWTVTRWVLLARSEGAGSCDSLFALSSSLFESVGNLFLDPRDVAAIPAIEGSASPGPGEIPCTFPADQGIASRD